MSSRMKALRTRRYKVKQTAKLKLVLQSVHGDSFEVLPIDVSLKGISVSMHDIDLEKRSIAEDQILPAAKLVWSDVEHSLGRVVVKSIRPRGEGQKLLGLMLIDGIVPIEGKFALNLDINISDGADPNDYELGPEDVNLGDFLGKGGGTYDLFTKARRYDIFHEAWKKTPRWGYYIPRLPSKGTRVRLGVSRPNKRDDFIIMASNDYLGISSRPEVVEAAKFALDKYGFGSTGSAVTVGQTEEHDRLEEKLSRTFRTEASLLFNSGYSANIGIISAMIGPEDLVVADILSHASIYDGMQMSPGIKRFFKHNDLVHLERILERSRHEAGGGLIVVEGVFSMDGDSAPLSGIKKLAQKYGCRILIDEAHSFGVLGRNGLGLAEEDGLLGGMDITMGTFSKICGGIGGFVCSSREVVNWMRIAARSAFFSVSIPPSTAAAMNAALDIFLSEPELLGRLRHNIDHFCGGLRELGFQIPQDHRSAIVPVVVGDENKMAEMYKILFNSGVYTIPVIYPAVSRNNCRFRFTVSAAHHTSDLDYALLVLKRAMEAVGLKVDPNQKAVDAEAS